MLHGEVEWEDLDIFFDEFAIDAVLYMDNDNGVTQGLKGIFETPYHKRDFGAFIVDAESPSFTCKWDDSFQYVRKGDALFPGFVYDNDEDKYLAMLGGSETYYVDSTPQNDGTGVVSFILTPATTQDSEGDELDDTIDEDVPMGGLFSPNPGAS